MFILKESAESDARDTLGDEKYAALKQAGYKFKKTLWGTGSDGDDISGWLVQCPDKTTKEISYEDLEDLGDEALKNYIPPKKPTTDEEVLNAALAILRKYDKKREVSPGIYKETIVGGGGREEPVLKSLYKEWSYIVDIRNPEKIISTYEEQSTQKSESFSFFVNKNKDIIRELRRVVNDYDSNDFKKYGIVSHFSSQYVEYADKINYSKIDFSGVKKLLEDIFSYSLKKSDSVNAKILLERLFKYYQSKKMILDTHGNRFGLQSENVWKKQKRILIGTSDVQISIPLSVDALTYCEQIGIDPQRIRDHHKKEFSILLDSFTEDQIKNSPIGKFL